MVSSLITEDTEKFGVGLWDLNVKMARRLGYTETEIQTMCNNLAVISHNYNSLLEDRLKNLSPASARRGRLKINDNGPTRIQDRKSR